MKKTIITIITVIVTAIIITGWISYVKGGFESIHISVPEVETETGSELIELAVQIEAANIRGEKFTCDFS